MDIETRARIEHLEGRVTAALVAISALIASHPDQKAAHLTVAKHLDAMAGTALASNQPDDFVNGLTSAETAIFLNMPPT